MRHIAFPQSIVSKGSLKIRPGFVGALLGSFLVIGLGASPTVAAPAAAHVRERLSGLRIPFIANLGQVDAQVAYYAHTFAGTLFVTHVGQLVYGLPVPGATGHGVTLTETFVDGLARPTAESPSAISVSTFLGRDRGRWRPTLPTYDRVGLGEVWSGVTVVLHARGRSLEKVFTVRPGASVDRIRVRVGGTDALSLNAAGALVAATAQGPITFTAPVAYQEREGVRRDVPVAYAPRTDGYGFTVGEYDRTLPLVIDPLLQSTYLGGTADQRALAMAIHPQSGEVYVAGFTVSADFPGTTGGAQPASGGQTDAFVARLNGALTTLVQATYLGGSANDSATALAIHPTTGDVYLAGHTVSGDFPGTAGGADPTYGGGGGIFFVPPPDAFVARLNGALTTLVQATYFGESSKVEIANAVAIHPVSGDVYIAGQRIVEFFVGPPSGDTREPRFSPASVRDAFVARLNGDLTTLSQARFVGAASGGTGGAANAMAIHPSTGDVYIAGFTHSDTLEATAGGAQPALGGLGDGFAMRWPADLSAPIQSTYLGGSADDAATSLGITSAGDAVYIAGATFSADFPGTSGSAQPARQGTQDAFVARLNSGLTSLARATYLGGNGSSGANAVATSALTGDVYVAGSTSSTDFPGTAGGAQPVNAGDLDGFVARLGAGLTELAQATYLGGLARDVGSALAVHPMTGDIYGAGTTASTDFPGDNGGAQATSGGGEDAFVSRLTFGLAAQDPPFADVLPSHPFAAFIEALFDAASPAGAR